MSASPPSLKVKQTKHSISNEYEYSGQSQSSKKEESIELTKPNLQVNMLPFPFTSGVSSRGVSQLAKPNRRSSSAVLSVIWTLEGKLVDSVLTVNKYCEFVSRENADDDINTSSWYGSHPFSLGNEMNVDAMCELFVPLFVTKLVFQSANHHLLTCRIYCVTKQLKPWFLACKI